MRGKLGQLTKGLNGEVEKWKVDEKKAAEQQARIAKTMKDEAERMHKAGRLTEEMLEEAKRVALEVLDEHANNEPLPLPADYMRALDQLRLSKEEAKEEARKE